MSIIIPDTSDQNSYLTWRRETKKRAKEDTIKIMSKMKKISGVFLQEFILHYTVMYFVCYADVAITFGYYLF